MKEKSTAISVGAHESRDLFGRTLRTVAILVGACVLFVGTLSVVAVVITNKATGERKAAGVSDTESAAPNKPGLSHRSQSI